MHQTLGNIPSIPYKLMTEIWDSIKTSDNSINKLVSIPSPTCFGRTHIPNDKQ